MRNSVRLIPVHDGVVTFGYLVPRDDRYEAVRAGGSLIRTGSYRMLAVGSYTRCCEPFPTKRGTHGLGASVNLVASR